MITVNGHDILYDEKTSVLLRTLEYFFCDKFWSQTAFLFTKLPMSPREIERRKRNSNDNVEELFRESLKVEFPSSVHSQFLFLDAHYDVKDESEKKAFFDSVTVVREPFKVFKKV